MTVLVSWTITAVAATKVGDTRGAASARREHTRPAVDAGALGLRASDLNINVEVAKLGLARVQPRLAGLAVLAFCFAIPDISRGANLEYSVVRRRKAEAESASVDLVGGRWHDDWIQNGDEGAFRKLIVTRECRVEQEEVDGPFQVRQGDDHVFVCIVESVVVDVDFLGRLLGIFMLFRIGLGCHDAEYYEVSFDFRELKLRCLNSLQKLRYPQDFLVLECPAEERLW